jgi:hypothetical protein
MTEPYGESQDIDKHEQELQYTHTLPNPISTNGSGKRVMLNNRSKGNDYS